MYQPSEDPRLQDIESLGRGGTAEVVNAFHRDLKQRVAVKYALPRTGDNPIDFAALARREYDLIGRYRFPGLVRILEDPSPDFDHIVLELCRGTTLDRFKQAPDIPTALNIVSALAVNLEFLNAAGLVHGDLKPHNVFLTENTEWLPAGRPGWIKLSDFSMGRRRDEHDRFRMGLGTVGFMAPETVADGTANHRSDLFALGIIAYQLLTGKHPFMNKNSDPVEVNSRIRETSPPPVASLRPDLEDAVGNLVNSLLAREEAERPACAWEVCLELEKAGATYPFRRTLRPAHLLQRQGSYEANREGLLDLNEVSQGRLDILTDGSVDRLGIVLEYNFRRNNLRYESGRFSFRHAVIWPHCLRQKELARFAGWGFGERRTAIVDCVRRYSLDSDETEREAASALSQLLAPLLKVRTVKLVAGRLAKPVEGNSCSRAAARLYLMAGQLTESERCAYQAAMELKRDLKYSQALRLLAEVIEYAELSERRWEVRQLLMLQGDNRKDSGEIDLARASYQQLIDLYAERPKDKLLAVAYKALGDIHRMRQDTDASLQALEESLAVFTELGDELEISHTRTNIGNVHWLRGANTEALRNYRAALTIQKRLKAAADYASTLHNIATIYGISGRTRRGLFLLEYSLRLKKEIGHLGEIARTLNNLGYIYQISGQPARAAENISEALEINRRIGSKKELAYNLENLAELMISAGRLRESMGVLREGIQLASDNGYVRHLAALRIHTATVQKRMGQYGEAARSLTSARQSLDGIDDKPLEVAWKVQEAGVKYHLGRLDHAEATARSAYAEAERAKDAVGMLNSLLLLSRLSLRPEDYEEAVGIINEQHLKRERVILDFGRLEYMVENESPDEASRLADTLLKRSFPEEQDIELPWMLNLCAEMFIRRGEIKTASAYLDRSSRAASTAGLVPELIVSLTLQGKLEYAEGNFEACFADYKKALQLCKKTSDNISVPEDRSLYQSKRIVRFLAQEIKALSRRLGEKQRAG